MADRKMDHLRKPLPLSPFKSAREGIGEGGNSSHAGPQRRWAFVGGGKLRRDEFCEF